MIFRKTVIANTIIASHKGFLYHTRFLSCCLGVRLYTKPTNWFSGFLSVNKLMMYVTIRHTLNAIHAMLNAWLVPE